VTIFTDVPEEDAASIFRIEEASSSVTDLKVVASVSFGTSVNMCQTR
jgi:hypothetical protein